MGEGVEVEVEDKRRRGTDMSSGYKPRRTTVSQAKINTTTRQRFGSPQPGTPTPTSDPGARQTPLTFESALEISKTGFDTPIPATPTAPAQIQPKPKSPAKADSFPLVSVLPRPQMEEVVRLMDEDLAYQEQEEAVKKARRDIKTALAAALRPHGLAGVRYGQVVVYYNGSKTRRTLNKLRLLENGVSVDQINASYAESEPWEDVRIVDMSKPKKKHDDGEED